ncbi:hypothetical protein [Burkholderia pseudomallei]|uniref:hypothetical protein n=1 Tax=Burkholderia pseudomallei TaxID=28450 RepID=UPI0029329869|nr:hypothetical protein [Burkholderia pseudomallei]MDV2182664.1 hypothetical protein [Burkholderia pseudomallei]
MSGHGRAGAAGRRPVGRAPAETDPAASRRPARADSGAPPTSVSGRDSDRDSGRVSGCAPGRRAANRLLPGAPGAPGAGPRHAFGRHLPARRSRSRAPAACRDSSRPAFGAGALRQTPARRVAIRRIAVPRSCRPPWRRHPARIGTARRHRSRRPWRPPRCS